MDLHRGKPVASRKCRQVLWAVYWSAVVGYQGQETRQWDWLRACSLDCAVGPTAVCETGPVPGGGGGCCQAALFVTHHVSIQHVHGLSLQSYWPDKLIGCCCMWRRCKQKWRCLLTPLVTNSESVFWGGKGFLRNVSMEVMTLSGKDLFGVSNICLMSRLSAE